MSCSEKDKNKKCKILKQEAEAKNILAQKVGQNNLAQQKNAIAVAILGGYATAIQYADQTNWNAQFGQTASVNSNNIGNSNCGSECCCKSKQDTDSDTKQLQDICQENFNDQNLLVAAALGSESSAVAVQYCNQDNDNTQNGESVADNNISSNVPVFGNSPSNANTLFDKSQRNADNILANIKNAVTSQNNSGTNIVMSIKQGNDLMDISINEKGEIVVNDNKRPVSELISSSAEIDELLSHLNISINQGDNKYEIKADENGDIYFNGHKLEIE